EPWRGPPTQATQFLEDLLSPLNANCSNVVPTDDEIKSLQLVLQERASFRRLSDQKGHRLEEKSIPFLDSTLELLKASREIVGAPFDPATDADYLLPDRISPSLRFMMQIEALAYLDPPRYARARSAFLGLLEERAVVSRDQIEPRRSVEVVLDLIQRAF